MIPTLGTMNERGHALQGKSHSAHRRSLLSGAAFAFLGSVVRPRAVMIAHPVAVSCGIASPSMITRSVTRRLGWW